MAPLEITISTFVILSEAKNLIIYQAQTRFFTLFRMTNYRGAASVRLQE